MKFSFWLLPPQKVLTIYNKIIEDISKQYNTPGLQAHVTLLSSFEGNEKTLIKQIDETIESFRSIPLSLTGVSFSSTYFQCVFAQVKMSAPLLNAHNELKSALGFTQEYAYFPHMSLVYGNLTAELRQKLAKEIKLTNTKFLAEKLVIVRADSHDPKDWLTVKEFNLKKT